jgi:nitroreductase/NAD-dependent dihydropyrimidine dehydrogenase PreA subunit
MIKIDNKRCVKCGICLSLRGDYCLNETKNGLIEIVHELCNHCTKCIAVCPQKAFTYKETEPKSIDNGKMPDKDNLEMLLKKRRSVRNFTDKKVSREILSKIAEISIYAPSMNRDIEAIIIDDKEIMSEIDRVAFKFYNNIYKYLFNNKILLSIMNIFSEDIEITKKKLENSVKSGKIVYDAPAMIILLGDKRVILTEISAQYHLYNIMLYCESMGLATCLMDSVKIIMSAKKKLRKMLNIPNNLSILGAVLIGYPKEKLINTAEGMSMKYSWNIRN